MPIKMGPWEIGIILVIFLIVFGVGKLPQVGSVIGKGIREFRRAARGGDEKAAKSAVSEAKRLESLEDENKRLKQTVKKEG